MNVVQPNRCVDILCYQLMNLGQKILGKRMYDGLMRKTFYKQFVAGETTSELKQSVEDLKTVNVRPILCVPIEEESTDLR